LDTWASRGIPDTELMNQEMTAQLVNDALVMAIWRRGRPEELLHHSDQGGQTLHAVVVIAGVAALLGLAATR
jgi:transposase InsO family protein